MWIRVALFLATSVPIAIVANAGRVTSDWNRRHHYNPALADGFIHEAQGMVNLSRRHGDPRFSASDPDARGSADVAPEGGTVQ